MQHLCFPKVDSKCRINKVTLIFVTSSIPTHPDNSIIKLAIDSVLGCDYNFYDIFITYDKPKNLVKDYDKYIAKMKKEYPEFQHIVLEHHGHFIGSLYQALCHCKTKYFLLVQHDIKLVGNIPVQEIINYSFDWNIIATHHKKSGLNEPTHWFPIIEDFNTHLQKTYGWSERIFIGKTIFFINKIYEIYHNKISNNFLDTIFYKQFTKLYKKLEGIKSYKYLNPETKNKKIYDSYWDDWKCFVLKSDICFHQHLHGRTKKNKNNLLKS